MATKEQITIHLRTGESTAQIESSDAIATTKLTSSIIPTNLVPVSAITINIDSIQLYDPLSLASLITSLRKDGNGKIILQIPVGDNNVDMKPFHASIALAGLTSQSEKTENGKCCITTVFKPKQKFSSAAIKPNSIKMNAPVTINIGDLDGDDDLINEDELLTSAPTEINAPEEIDMVERQKQLDDCGGRKACDDCTCGRKEMEEGENLAKEEKQGDVPKSACGNCSKGDAFRCAGCPFLGKPAFKEGEEHVVLDLTDDL
jgi:hypothetical protein